MSSPNAIRRRIATTCTATFLSLVSLSAPSTPTVLAAAPSKADVDVGGSGRTLMAGINVGEPDAEETSSCRWRTTVISDDKYEPYSFSKRNGVTYRWYARVCRSASIEGGFDVSYHWVPVVSDTTMASQASKYAFGLIPVPLVGTSPPAHRGIVSLPMWWWVSASTWRTVSVSVWIPTPTGPFVVRATARPVKLIIDPDDPRARSGGGFSCAGPGLAWTPSMGDAATGPCMYTYDHAVRAARASVSIDWAISWKSNRGAAGRLPNRRTTRTIRVSVNEIQALVSG